MADSTQLAGIRAASLSEHLDTEYHLEPIRRALRQRIEEGRFAS